MAYIFGIHYVRPLSHCEF